MFMGLIVGIVGLLIWFICTRMELEAGGSDISVTARLHFFRNTGIGLVVIGFGWVALLIALGAI